MELHIVDGHCGEALAPKNGESADRARRERAVGVRRQPAEVDVGARVVWRVPIQEPKNAQRVVGNHAKAGPVRHGAHAARERGGRQSAAAG